jgi:C1A family cysteine protease
MISNIQRRYGQRRDPHDDRDRTYKLTARVVYPTNVDNRAKCAPIRDQLDVGACTGFAGSEALAYDRNVQNLPAYVYSPLDLYYWTRQRERLPWEPDGDNGATIRGTIKTAIKRGVCSEKLWPYVTSNVLVQPPAECDAEALLHKGLVYERVPQDVNHIRSVFVSDAPLVFGINVYTSFESNAVARTGKVPMPNTKKEQFLGGHALMACGYLGDSLIVQNSWSDEWGDHGFCYIPLDYVLSRKLANDLWTIRTVQ